MNDTEQRIESLVRRQLYGRTAATLREVAASGLRRLGITRPNRPRVQPALVIEAPPAPRRR